MLKIADILDKICVDEVELGIPNTSEQEISIIKEINSRNYNFVSSCVYFCLNDSNIDESIENVLRSGCSSVCISIATSKKLMALKTGRNEKGIISLMKHAVSCAVDKGLKVVFSGEDASRADLSFLIDYICTGEECGASRFRFAETVSCMEPLDVSNVISKIKASTNIDIEIHSHSAYGLALANSAAALHAGASWVSSTVNGIGERGGNCNTIDMILYLYRFKKQENYNTQYLKALSDYVVSCTRDTGYKFTPIIGSDAFYYENYSNYKHKKLYQAYPPELVGNTDALVLGKTMYEKVLEVWGFTLSNEEKSYILNYMYEHKKCLTKSELEQLLKSQHLP